MYPTLSMVLPKVKLLIIILADPIEQLATTAISFAKIAEQSKMAMKKGVHALYVLSMYIKWGKFSYRKPDKVGSAISK